MKHLAHFIEQLEPWEVWSLLSFIGGLSLGKVISYWDVIVAWCGS